MNLNRMFSICHSACRLAGCAILAGISGGAATALAAVWWDSFPRVVSTGSVADQTRIQRGPVTLGAGFCWCKDDHQVSVSSAISQSG